MNTILAAWTRNMLRGENIEQATHASPTPINWDAVPIPGDEVDERLDALLLGEKNAHKCIKHLRLATMTGGRNDPMAPESATVWLAFLWWMLKVDLAVAEMAAGAWYAALFDANFETDSVIPHRATAAYLVGVINARLGSDEKATEWLHLAQMEAEADGDTASAYLGACRFGRAGAPR